MFKLIKQAKSVKNRLINLYKNELSDGKKILIIGGFHGDEPQGANILNEYIKTSQAAKNQLWILPCLNPDGYTVNKRTNANSVDLNRNFPTKNWKLTEKNEFFGGTAPKSEPETNFMVKLLEDISPDIILTIHAPFKIVNYDGTAKEISEKIAKILNYKTEHDIGYPTPGSFGTYCGAERNIPTVTLELGEDESYEWQKQACYKVFDLLANI